MRPLLERIVEKTRSPEAGARSMLMPLVAPLYGPASGFSEPRMPERLDEVAVSAETLGAIAPSTPVRGVRQSVAKGIAQGIAHNPVVQFAGATQRPAPPRTAPSAKEPPRSAELLLTERKAAPEVFMTSTDRRPASPDAFAPAAYSPTETAAPPLSLKPVHATPPTDAPVAAETFHDSRSTAFVRTDFAHTEARQATRSPAPHPVLPPPQVTVSIGHIEVHAAQAQPAERPRRPEFRPSLSLSDFLNASDRGRS